MTRLGLALSGGGFRATLFHLGVVRCLRDAGTLAKISHITTVSGGSVLGAHLALNWDRYAGTDEQFDEAAAEVIRFVQLDVRNRILRRFPFTEAANRFRSMVLLKPRRQWTRAGLLERYYERFLYGDTPLSKLPDNPRLHVLATNLSEGCICSFNRDGLQMQSRSAGGGGSFRLVRAELATVPMAVAASSCFPGFFPPLQLTGWDVGADSGEFLRHAFTDGGIYDNLGLRMFRCIEERWRERATTLNQDHPDSFDGILVSDAGGQFKVNPDAQGGGLISTAIRASDILMDRVWQLESEAFENKAGVVFIPITDVVRLEDDPDAIDLLIQRQTPKIRTDLDFFSDFEISSLIQHGYGVTRQILHQHTKWIGKNLPSGPPWAPAMGTAHEAEPDDSNMVSKAPQASALMEARRLRNSSNRKTASTLLSLRDWTSYVWLMLVLGVAAGVFYFVIQRNEQLKQHRAVMAAVGELNPDYRTILDLLQNHTIAEFTPMEPEDALSVEKTEQTSFEVISESRVFDLRNWNDPNLQSPAVGYTRTRVRRLADSPENTILRLQRDLRTESYQIDCKSQRLNPRLLRMDFGDGLYRWELQLDFTHIPMGSHADVVNQLILPSELANVFGDEGRFRFDVRMKTGLLQVWLLMPEDREYSLFEVSSHPIEHPERSEVVVPAGVVDVAAGNVAAFRLIDPEPDRRYEFRWTWREPVESR